MAIQFRNYTSQAGITKDYERVRSFLIMVGYCEYTYARWDWMTTHGYLDKKSAGKIGIWDRLIASNWYASLCNGNRVETFLANGPLIK